MVMGEWLKAGVVGPCNDVLSCSGMLNVDFGVGLTKICGFAQTFYPNAVLPRPGEKPFSIKAQKSAN